TLAIGVGATTAIFSALNVLLLRPLPYARPNELMRVSLILPAEDMRPRQSLGLAYPMFTMLRDAQRSYADLSVYANSQLTLTSGASVGSTSARRICARWDSRRRADATSIVRSTRTWLRRMRQSFPTRCGRVGTMRTQ